jgi:hypothetical protein
MKIYLAGPMRGYDCFNFPAFHAATKDLRNRGHLVHSPAEHDEESGFDPTLNTLDGFNLHEAFTWDTVQVLWCDAVVCLPGWHGSHGSQIEVSIARATGKKVLAYSTEALVPVEDEDVTMEANRIVRGHRRKEYGHPYDNFKRIARMWEVIFGVDVSPYQVGLAMVALKLCREINSPTRDGRVDIAGYAETLEIVNRVNVDS